MPRGKENYKAGELLKSLPVGVVLVDPGGRVTMTNRRAREIFGQAETGPTGQAAFGDQLSRLFDPGRLPFLAIKKTGLPIFGVERQIEKPDGSIAIISLNCAPFSAEDNQIKGALCTLEEITDQRLSEEDREKLIQELMDQSLELERLNDALKVLLAQRHQDKEDMEDNIILNLKSLVMPYLERLRLGPLSSEQRTCLEVALANLGDLFSSFGKTLRSPSLGLTPREFEVADLVKQGKPSKEIAEILCISVRSVETHRRAIRRKLGLKGKSKNLRTSLASLK